MDELLSGLSCLVGLIPTLELLNGDQSDEQGEEQEKTLLDVQRRNTQLCNTLAVHLQTPLGLSGQSI